MSLRRNRRSRLYRQQCLGREYREPKDWRVKLQTEHSLWNFNRMRLYDNGSGGLQTQRSLRNLDRARSINSRRICLKTEQGLGRLYNVPLRNNRKAGFQTQRGLRNRDYEASQNR